MLSFLLWLPVVGASIIGFLPGKIASARLRQIATIFAMVIFAWSIWLLTQFDISNSGWQFSEYLPWIEPIGLSYSLAIDGLSLPLVILNGLLTIIAIYSIGENVERPRLYYSLILLINAGITGALIAQNLLLFVIFYELELIPFYLMIAIWGGEKRGYAATKFLLYTAVSGLLVLAAFLGIGFLNGGSSFDYDTITTQGLSLTTQLILLTVLLVGFGIKIPLVPLHTWLPDAYTEASPAVTILLGGILAKLGTYGLIRFGLQLFPKPGIPALAIPAIISKALVRGKPRIGFIKPLRTSKSRVPTLRSTMPTKWNSKARIKP